MEMGFVLYDNNTNINEIINTFKRHNLKITPQRVSIYSYLMNTHDHPSVDMIYDEIKKNLPSISLATVYKTLNVLVECNLVKMINISKDNFRYDANLNPHCHIKCTKCNTVHDVNLHNVVNMNSLSKYNIESFDLMLYGMCNKCS